MLNIDANERIQAANELLDIMPMFWEPTPGGYVWGGLIGWAQSKCGYMPILLTAGLEIVILAGLPGIKQKLDAFGACYGDIVEIQIFTHDGAYFYELDTYPSGYSYAETIFSGPFAQLH